VYVHAKPAAYLQLMKDVDRLNKLAGYSSAGGFNTPPNMTDVDGLALDYDDIEDLKNCRPGNCELQLPEESMDAARKSIDWTSSDVAGEVNELAKRRIIKLLEDYLQNGDHALGTYRDQRDPLPVGEQYQKAADKAGIGGVGTHSLRHTHRSWLDSVGTPVGVQQKLMQHSDIRTTMNVYGDAATAEMAEAHSKVVRLALSDCTADRRVGN
jgi:hypothetical protein